MTQAVTESAARTEAMAMGVLSDQHNEWLDRQALEARMEADPELRGLIAAAWSEGYRAGYDDLWHASGRGTEVREAETANPYSEAS